MAQVKLKAPVGLSPRTSEGDAVRNNPDDIEIVRKMLAANGFNVPEGRKVDAGLIKAIGAFQKKAGFKWPDKVVDPGGRTLKALMPKHVAAEKAAAKEESVPMRKVKWKGKDYLLTERDYQLMRLDIFKRLDRYIKSLIKMHKTNLDTYREYLDTARIKNGLFNAATQAIIMNWKVKFPNSSLAGKSIAATGALERAVMTKDLAMLETALPEAEKAINAFSADVKRFLTEFTGSAQIVGTTLTVTSATCFAIVGVMAAPQLVVATGMSAAKATVVSGAGVGVLQSASQELGKHAGGQDVTVWQSVWAITIDGGIGALTAGVGNKLPVKFLDKIAAGIAPKLAAKLPYVTAQQLKPFLVKYLAGTGAEVMKSAVSEAVKIIGKSAKSGKMPTEKDFDDAVQSVLMTALTAGLLKKLGGFQKKWAYKNKELLKGQILPDRLARFPKANDLPNVLKAKLYADVANKVSEEAMKLGVSKAIEVSGGSTDDENKLIDIAAKELKKDKRIEKIIDAEIEKALKKHKAKAA